MKRPPAQVTSCRLASTATAAATQWEPSGLEKTAPASPTATSLDPLQARRVRADVPSGVRAFHHVPSGLTATVPASPTATNWEPVQATSRRLARTRLKPGFHDSPSALVSTVP